MDNLSVLQDTERKFYFEALQDFIHYWRSLEARREFFLRTIFYFFIYFLFILPIIRANYFYVDDISRNLTGHAGWTSVGRPLTNVLMKAVNFNLWTLSDLAPLPQLMATAILSLASAWTSMAFRLRFGFALLPVAFIVCNPFFMENLSYRYDSLSMVLAVVLAMLPVALEKMPVGISLYFSIFASLVLALNLYQPAVNVFIVFTCFAALRNLRLHNDLFKTMFRFFAETACLVAAMGIYKAEITFIELQKYAQPHAQFVGLSNLSPILRNLRHCYAFLARNLLHTHQTQLLLAGMFLGLLVFIVKFVNASWFQDRAALSLIFAAFLIMGILGGIMGPVVLLQHPVWAPRVLIGFGAVGACVLSLLFLECQTSIFRPIVLVLLVVILLAQFSLSYAFGNILIAQGNLDSVVANQIVNDAFSMANDKPSSLVILGEAPEPLNVQRETKWYPILHRLLPSHQKNFWTWGPFLKLHGLPHNIKFFPHLVPNQHLEKQLKACRFRTISKRLYYNTYSNGTNIIVDFNKRCNG
jgi:hypothetical protein